MELVIKKMYMSIVHYTGLIQYRKEVCLHLLAISQFIYILTMCKRIFISRKTYNSAARDYWPQMFIPIVNTTYNADSNKVTMMSIYLMLDKSQSEISGQ